MENLKLKHGYLKSNADDIRYKEIIWTKEFLSYSELKVYQVMEAQEKPEKNDEIMIKVLKNCAGFNDYMIDSLSFVDATKIMEFVMSNFLVDT